MVEIWENIAELTKDGKQLQDDFREKLEPIVTEYAMKGYHSTDAYNLISDVLYDLWEKHSPLSEHVDKMQKQYTGEHQPQLTTSINKEE